jgi:hypothetical protein
LIDFCTFFSSSWMSAERGRGGAAQRRAAAAADVETNPNTAGPARTSDLPVERPLLAAHLGLPFPHELLGVLPLEEEVLDLLHGLHGRSGCQGAPLAQAARVWRVYFGLAQHSTACAGYIA